MISTHTAITKKRGDWWVGAIEEVPGVNAQEKSKEERLTSLLEVLTEAMLRQEGACIRGIFSGFTPIILPYLFIEN